MKAIETYIIGPTGFLPSRVVATTREKGQRIILSLPIVYPAWAHGNPHAFAAATLARRYGWQGELVSGGFPDGRMVWCFTDSERVKL